MRIIKQGTPPAKEIIHRFECIRCNCMFDATDNDVIQTGVEESPYLACNCPCCREVVMIRGKKGYNHTRGIW